MRTLASQKTGRKYSTTRFAYLVISRRPREIAATVDEDVIVEERHVAGRWWTTGEFPFGVVGRRRVQRGVQHYDATVADLRAQQKRGVSSRNRNVMRGIRRGDFRVSSTEFRGNALPRVSHLRSLLRRATKNHLRLRVSTFLKKFPHISAQSPFRNRLSRVCYGQSGFRDRLYARWRARRAHVLAWLQFACAMQTSRVRSLNKQRQVSRRIRKTV